MLKSRLYFFLVFSLLQWQVSMAFPDVSPFATEERSLIEAISTKSLSKAIQILNRIKKQCNTPQDLIRWNYYQGVVAFESYRFFESLTFLEKAKEIASSSKDYVLYSAHIDYQLGRVYKDGLFNGEIARQFYTKSINAYKQLGDHEEDIAKVNFQIARSYPSNELEKRAIYNQRALDFFQLNSAKYKAEIAECLNLEALRIVNKEGLTDNAEKLLLKAIDLGKQVGVNRSRTLGKYYDNLGFLYYSQRKNKDLSIRILKKGLIQNSRFTNQEYWIASSYTNLGSVYLDAGVFDSAKVMLKEALRLKSALYPEDHPEISFSYEHVASAFSGINDLDSALYYYNRALGITARNPIPKISESMILNPYLLNYAYTISNRSKLLKEKFLKTKDIKFLDDAFLSFTIIDSVLQKSYENYEWETSKTSYLRTLSDFYDTYMDICYSLYEIKNDAQFAYKGLHCMESTRYLSVLDNQNKFQNQYFVKNPKLLDRDLNMRGLLVQQYYLLSIADKQSTPDSTKKIQAKLNELAQHYSAFQDSLKINQNNPLTQLKLDKSIHNSIPKKQLIVEFKETENSFYIIGIDEEQILFRKITKSAKLVDAINELNQVVSTPPVLESFSANKISFKHNAELVYKMLLADFHDLLMSSKITYIIPDHSLYPLPFEILLPTKETKERYADFNYLINKLPITKALSIRLLLQQREEQQVYKGPVLAFGSTESSMGLGSVEEEINTIGEYFSVDKNIGEFCRTDHFLNKAADYPLIHLALHGKQDPANQHRSHLVFSEGDTLFAYSLYSIKLNNPLVLLSACESGIGNQHDGEGIFSMARAFSLAGASSVYMNLWEVNDNTASILSGNFYKALKKNESPQIALQLAKLDYLKNKDDYLSHPYFWTSAQLISNTFQQPPNRLLQWWKPVVFTIIFFSMLLILFRFQKSKKKKQ